MNSGALRNLTLQHDVHLERRTLTAGSPVVDLLDVGLKEQTLAPIVLTALFAELSRQTT